MSNNDVGRIGARVRSARVRLGWSRETLASTAGVSFSAVVQIEAGRRGEPRIATVAALAGALDVSVDYLIGRSLTTRPPLTHCAFFYDDDDELVSAAVPFLTEGLEREEALVVVTTRPRLQRVREGLGDNAAHVEFVESVDWCTAPSETLGRFRAVMHDRIAAGHSWVRAVAEPIWAGRSPSEAESWMRFEALLNLSLAAAPATIVCPYNSSALAEDILAVARHTHPKRFDAEGITPDGGDAEQFILDRGDAARGSGSRRRSVRP